MVLLFSLVFFSVASSPENFSVDTLGVDTLQFLKNLKFFCSENVDGRI